MKDRFLLKEDNFYDIDNRKNIKNGDYIRLVLSNFSPETEAVFKARSRCS